MSEIKQENNESQRSDSKEIIELKNKILELEDKLKLKCNRIADKIYFIRFVMQKGDGIFPKIPSILNLFPDNDPLLIIKDNMKFLLNNDNDMLPINEYKVIEAYKYRNDSMLSKPLQGLYLKEETIVTNYIKALTQSYNNDIIANKTYYNK